MWNPRELAPCSGFTMDSAVLGLAQMGCGWHGVRFVAELPFPVNGFCRVRVSSIGTVRLSTELLQISLLLNPTPVSSKSACMRFDNMPSAHSAVRNRVQSQHACDSITWLSGVPLSYHRILPALPQL
jgi:hypothetical protein